MPLAPSHIAGSQRASPARIRGAWPRLPRRRALNGSACSHRPRTWLRSWRLKPVAVRTRPPPGISVCPVAHRDCSAPHFARAPVRCPACSEKEITYRNLLISTQPDFKVCAAGGVPGPGWAVLDSWHDTNDLVYFPMLVMTGGYFPYPRSDLRHDSSYRGLLPTQY